MQFRTRLKTSSNLIDLTALVDVVFLMLIFFIITSDILPLKSLNVQNPVLDRNSAPETTRLLVVMDAQNVIYVGSRKAIVDLQSLKPHLQSEIGKVKKQYPGTEPTVVLSVDKQVEYGDFLRVFSSCQECGPKLRLVYKPSDEENAEYF